jgi:hypothetical protein
MLFVVWPNGHRRILIQVHCSWSLAYWWKTTPLKLGYGSPHVAFLVYLLDSGGILGLCWHHTPSSIDQIYNKSVEPCSHTRGGKTPPSSYQEANHNSKPQVWTKSNHIRGPWNLWRRSPTEKPDRSVNISCNGGGISIDLQLNGCSLRLSGDNTN